MVAFTPTFTSNVINNAPAGFQTCVNLALNNLSTNLVDNITIAVTIDYAAIGGAVASSTVASSTFNIGWTTIYNALVAHAVTANDTQSLSNLTGSAPTGFPAGGLAASGPLCGLLGISGATTACTVTLGNSVTWCTDNSGGVPVGQYDLFGIVLHEITECLGRANPLGSRNTGATVSTIWRFSSSGTRNWDPTTAGYFSLDNGVTNLGDWNVSGSGDYLDWATPGPVANDAFNFTANTGVVLPMSSTDLILMDVIGYQLGALRFSPLRFRLHA